MPAKHAPRPLGYALPPVMGSMLDFTRDGQRHLRLYITGDTLMHDGLKATARMFSPVDVCVLHLGGTRVAGILLTMDGRQRAEALRVIRPREVIPVHFDDYTVFRSPLSEFRQAVKAARLPPRIHYLSRGETCRLSPGPAEAGSWA